MIRALVVVSCISITSCARPTSRPVHARAATHAAAPATSASGTRAPATHAKVEMPSWSLVLHREVAPHWLEGGDRFYYLTDHDGGGRDIVMVDATNGTRAPVFDRARLANGLTKLLGRQMRPDALALKQLRLDAGASVLRFSMLGNGFRCDLATYDVVEEPAAFAPPSRLLDGGAPERTTRTGPAVALSFANKRRSAIEVWWMAFDGKRTHYATIAPGDRHVQHTYEGHVWVVTDGSDGVLAAFETPEDGGDIVLDDTLVPAHPKALKTADDGEPSPDGRTVAFVKDHNIWLHDATGKRADVALSHDGSAGDSYSAKDFSWSPDGARLVALRTAKGGDRKVYLIESSPEDQIQPKLDSYEYLKPGDRIPVPRIQLFDVMARKKISVGEALTPNPWSISDVTWASDSSRFDFVYNQRGHQLLRVVSADAKSGAVRTLIEERSTTFIDYSGKSFFADLRGTHEIIWMSERDGWNHLYLYDAENGAVKNAITHGAWAVRGVESVDPTRRQIWFYAGGVYPGQDPYYVHLCRVSFDGTGFTVLTQGDGTHSVVFSPDRRYFLDTWSRVDQPPVVELRRGSDGSLVREIERADIRPLLATGWRPPEPFVAKGRDGTTDIYGVIVRPADFDSSKRYPVIEDIYAGPGGAHVQKAFGLEGTERELAARGFIVVQIDGMGTSFRSKAFQDVAWKNLGDAGFPDRIAWMKAAAQKHPELDLSRVGIYGGSAGGQNALRALLSHGDFYKVAVADSGCHDNRMDKIWWNEQWMGWPVDESYAKSSNVVDAHLLTGDLMLIVGELDRNVDPSSTMQVVNALIKANKDFDLLVVPGGGHGAGESDYGRRRRADFFARHLQ